METLVYQAQQGWPQSGERGRQCVLTIGVVSDGPVDEAVCTLVAGLLKAQMAAGAAESGQKD